MKPLRGKWDCPQDRYVVIDFVRYPVGYKSKLTRHSLDDSPWAYSYYEHVPRYQDAWFSMFVDDLHTHYKIVLVDDSSGSAMLCAIEEVSKGFPIEFAVGDAGQPVVINGRKT